MTHTLTLNPPILLTFKRGKLAIFWTLTLILIFILLVSYIFQVSFLTREIYLIKDYQRKLNNLSKENEILEIDFSKSNSLSNIENYLSEKNFVKAKQVKYIQILESSMVKK